MSMVCKEKVITQPGGEGKVVALILADETPATFPTTGANVEGIKDSDVLDGGSVLLDLSTSKKHILGNNGVWHVWE